MFRFLKDASYKEDTVLGLCMTTDAEVIDLAIALAKKYGVSLWEVHMTQLQYMFTSELTTKQIQQSIATRRVMAILKKKPTQFVETVQSKILPLVDGADHQRLMLCYKLVTESNAEEAVTREASSHLKTLKKLMSVAPTFNYSYCLRRHSDTLDHLRSVVTSENFTSLADLLTAGPGGKEAHISKSEVYCAWCIQHFLQLLSNDGSKVSAADWLNR